MDKQVRNAGFFAAVYNQLQKENPNLANKLAIDDISIITDTSMRVIAGFLKSGHRVILEGYFSFFTKPIKRKCSNLQNNSADETWWTFKRRIRIKPMRDLKKMVEVDITEKEYEVYKTLSEKRKKPAS